MEKTRIPLRTFTHAWAILPSLPDCTFFLYNGCSKIAVDKYKDSTRRLFAILTACMLIGDTCCMNCTYSTLLGLLVEQLLFPHSVLDSEEDIKNAFVPFHVLLGCSTKNHTIFDSFYIALHFLFLVGWFFNSSVPNCFPSFFFHLAFLPSCPLLCWAISDAALTPTKLCPIINRKKNIFPFSHTPSSFSRPLPRLPFLLA